MCLALEPKICSKALKSGSGTSTVARSPKTSVGVGTPATARASSTTTSATAADTSATPAASRSPARTAPPPWPLRVSGGAELSGTFITRLLANRLLLNANPRRSVPCESTSAPARQRALGQQRRRQHQGVADLPDAHTRLEVLGSGVGARAAETYWRVASQHSHTFQRLEHLAHGSNRPAGGPRDQQRGQRLEHGCPFQRQHGEHNFQFAPAQAYRRLLDGAAVADYQMRHLRHRLSKRQARHTRRLQRVGERPKAGPRTPSAQSGR